MSEIKLNRPQLTAVRHKNGPLLIIAGAGTGKTTVLTERIKRLIEKESARPDEILALTFTEKAAQEMQARIDEALPLGYAQMWIMTFHSFCDHLLRDEGIHIGLNPNFHLARDTDRLGLLKKHLFDFELDYFRPLGNPTKFLSALLDHFDRLRDEDITPKDYAAWVRSLPGRKGSEVDGLNRKQYKELSSAYSAFQQLKIASDLLDFPDLISFTLNLFRTRPNILQKYQQKFKYILIDEFQDTNYSQNLLINLLVTSAGNLTVVADDDQSIYRWRGAAVSNVIQFRKNYPDAKLVVLTANYRSTQEILDASYKLIQNNNPDRLEVAESISKHLVSPHRLHGPSPRFLHYDRLENEVEGVVQEIKKLISGDSPQYSPKDIAILVRANNHAQPFLNCLIRHGIPYQFLGPGRLFDQPEIKDLIGFFRLLSDPTDDQSLFRVLSMDSFKLSQKDLILLTQAAKKQQQPLYWICEHLPGSDLHLSDYAAGEISRLHQLINRYLEKTRTDTPGEILFAFLKETGILRQILDLQSPFDDIKVINITNFFNQLKEFETQNPGSTIGNVLEWIDLSSEIGESPSVVETDWSKNDAVSLLTVHSAKGLEFPVIFLVNLVVQRFPTSQKKELIPVPDPLIKEILPLGDAHLQEERRLFYVGLTRAKQLLYLTAAEYYGEGKRSRKLSPFVVETLGDEILSSSRPVSVQSSLFDWDKVSPLPKSGRPDDFRVEYLNYSQIQTFLDCPLHYKAKYILNIPAPPSAASSFGNTIHKTLKSYFELLSQGEKPDILKVYSHSWTPLGYASSRHARLFYERGEKYLADFVKKNPFPTPPVRLEDSFTLPLGKLKIGGKIDRVNLLPDGSLQIIDYKTGTHPPTQKEADADLQLSFYALAATLLPYYPYHRPPGKVKLTLYYFEDQLRLDSVRSAAQLKSAKEEIRSYADLIEQSDFACSRSLICKTRCDYRSLCSIS